MIRPLCVRVLVEIIEWNGEKLAPADEKYVYVESHWNEGNLVKISIGGESHVTVAAEGLIEAIKRATF